MNHDEHFEINEQARHPEIEPIECYTCGDELSNAESDDPFTIEVPVPGTKYHVEHIVCDKCKSEHVSLDWTAYNRAYANLYVHGTVKHI